MDDVMTVDEAANYLRISASTLAKLRLSGKGPTFLKLTRKVTYRRADLDAWIAARRRGSTSEYVKASA